MEFDYFYEGDLKMNREIKINLDPVTDGFVEAERQENEVSEHAFIIATNGDKRFADMDEVKEILKRLESKGASILIGNGKYMVIFNDDKTFEQMTGKFLVGSMLVMTIEDDVLSLIPDDELEVVMDLLENRMVTMVNDGERFSALEIL